MVDYLVETKSLTKRFGSKTALADFSIQIPAGGTYAVVGSNGAGKSTLFRLLLGMLTPSAGTCRLLGRPSAELEPETRGRVGYVNEEHTLPGWMKVRRLLDFQQGFYPNWNREIHRRVLANFDVGMNQRVSQLSRGERAGLNLSMALAQGPDLLILDEPTLGMDVVAKQAFLEALMFIGSEMNTTFIYCSHQMEEIERLAEQLIIMEKGHLRNFSTPEDFQERITSWIADFPEPPRRENLTGYLTFKEIEGQYHVSALDAGDGFEAVLRANGAESVTRCPVNFSQAVNAFLAKNHDSETPND